MIESIDKMNIGELADYAVTLSWWKWKPGMLAKYPNGGWYRLTESDPRPPDPGKARPDLEDPATLGCLLSICREKHGQNFFIECRDRCLLSINRKLRYRGLSRGDTCDGWDAKPIKGTKYTVYESYCWFDTEAHAMIESLED